MLNAELTLGLLLFLFIFLRSMQREGITLENNLLALDLARARDDLVISNSTFWVRLKTDGNGRKNPSLISVAIFF